jgi:hypothetical protein
MLCNFRKRARDYAAPVVKELQEKGLLPNSENISNPLHRDIVKLTYKISGLR